MFFGLTNSPATFQRFMNDSFRDMIAEGWLVIYMDDLLIFSPDEDTHRERTKHVLQRMTELDLHLILEKCHFATTEVVTRDILWRTSRIKLPRGGAHEESQRL